jgi:Icc-related predicted phosphoesterase
MKIVCISDLHGNLPEIPQCDLLLIAGDVCPTTDHRAPFQERWLRTTFSAWLRKVPARKIIVVWGNHDIVAETNPRMVEVPCTVLTDELVEWEGLRIYGLPWQRRFYDWAFNLDEPELCLKYDAIPECDVIVSHGPPFMFGDLTDRGEHVGCQAFLGAIERTGCTLAVYGHIHDGYGQYQYGDCRLVNASLCNERYQPVNDLQCIDYALAV